VNFPPIVSLVFFLNASNKGGHTLKGKEKSFCFQKQLIEFQLCEVKQQKL
jgi:hypothetical protein